MLPGLTKASPDRLSTSQLVFCQQTCFSRSSESSRDDSFFICRTPASCLPSRVSWELSIPVPPDFRSSERFSLLTVTPGDCRAGLRRCICNTQDCDFASVFEARSEHPVRTVCPPHSAQRTCHCTDEAVLLTFRPRRLATVKQIDQHPREENLQSFRGSPTGGRFFS
jgi:hypothetical protein